MRIGPFGHDVFAHLDLERDRIALFVGPEPAEVEGPARNAFVERILVESGALVVCHGVGDVDQGPRFLVGVPGNRTLGNSPGSRRDDEDRNDEE